MRGQWRCVCVCLPRTARRARVRVRAAEATFTQRALLGGSCAPPRLEREALPVASGRGCLLDRAEVQLRSGGSSVVGSGGSGGRTSSDDVDVEETARVGPRVGLFVFRLCATERGATYECWAVRYDERPAGSRGRRGEQHVSAIHDHDDVQKAPRRLDGLVQPWPCAGQLHVTGRARLLCDAALCPHTQSPMSAPIYTFLRRGNAHSAFRARSGHRPGRGIPTNTLRSPVSTMTLVVYCRQTHRDKRGFVIRRDERASALGPPPTNSSQQAHQQARSEPNVAR